MEPSSTKRVELVLPMRTLLVVAAAIGVGAAFAAIGETFLVVFVAVTLFGALLGVLGALTAVPLAATIQILVQELTKARREKVEAARATAGVAA